MSRLLTLILLAALSLLYFSGLADVGLLGPDEPRYAAIGRQMARSGDWVTPVLWGNPWFEKPALLYWMTGLGTVLGLGPELAPRLPVTLSAVLFLVFFYWILSRNLPGSPVPLYSTIILATSAAWMTYGFVAVTDMPLAVCSAAAMLLSVYCCAPAWVAGLLLGLAVLAKGLAGFVFFAPVAVWLLWNKQYRRLAITVAVALLVAAPWYVLCYLRNGQAFVDEFFIKHHFQRFSTDALRHVQPWYFYIPVMLGAVFPWTPLYGVLFRRSLYEDRRIAMIGLWALWGVVFFSISKNKLPGYILPVVPGVAVLLGLAADRSPRWVLAFSAWLLSVIPALAHILGPALDHGLTKVAIPNPPAWGVVVAGIATVWCLGKRRHAMVAVGLLFLIPVLYMKQVAFPVLNESVSAREAAKRGAPVCADASKRDLYYGLNYYLDVQQKLPVCGEVSTPP